MEVGERYDAWEVKMAEDIIESAEAETDYPSCESVDEVGAGRHSAVGQDVGKFQPSFEVAPPIKKRMKKQLSQAEQSTEDGKNLLIVVLVILGLSCIVGAIVGLTTNQDISQSGMRNHYNF